MYSDPGEFRGATEDDTEATEDRYPKHDTWEDQLRRREHQRRARCGERQVGAAAIAVLELDTYLVTAGRTIHRTSSAVTLTLELMDTVGAALPDDDDLAIECVCNGFDRRLITHEAAILF